MPFEVLEESPIGVQKRSVVRPEFAALQRGHVPRRLYFRLEARDWPDQPELPFASLVSSVNDDKRKYVSPCRSH